MTDQNDPPVDTTENDELAVLEETVHGLQIPIHAAELIADALNFLAQNGAEQQAVVLDDIYNAASQMLTTTQKLDQGFRASLSIAKVIRQQREEARQALATLKDALRNADTDNEDVAALWEAAEASINEEWNFYPWDMIYEEMIERMVGTTALNMRESRTLLDILTDSWIDTDHYLWDELSEWMERVEEVSDSAISDPFPDFD